MNHHPFYRCTKPSPLLPLALAFLCLMLQGRQILAVPITSAPKLRSRGISSSSMAPNSRATAMTIAPRPTGVLSIVSAMDWSSFSRWEVLHYHAGTSSGKLYVHTFVDQWNLRFKLDLGYLQMDHPQSHCWVPIGYLNEPRFDWTKDAFKLVEKPCTQVANKPARWQWNNASDNIILQERDNRLCLHAVKESHYLERIEIELRQCDESQEQIWFDFKRLVTVLPPARGANCLYLSSASPYVDQKVAFDQPCNGIDRFDKRGNWFYSYSDNKLHSGAEFSFCLASGMNQLTTCEKAPTFDFDQDDGRIIGESTPPPSNAPTLPPLRDECELKTSEVESNDEVVAAFENVELRASIVEAITYYSYGNSTVFKNTCRQQGGKPALLNFQATCRATSDSIVKKLDVGNRPVCYSIKCISSDKGKLFEEFTMRPTEVRANKELPDYGSWTCTANNTDKDIAEGTDGMDVCVRETLAIATTDTVEATFKALTPKLKDKKTWIPLFTKKEKDVVFLNEGHLQSYESACKKGNFNFMIKKDFKVECTNSIGTDATRELSFSRFPACIGGTCLLTREQEKMAMEELLTQNVALPREVCTIVSGSVAISTGVAIWLFPFVLGIWCWFPI